jgi:hypothetical protein
LRHDSRLPTRRTSLKDAQINGITFRHGKAYTSDGTNPEDWEHTFSVDRILDPDHGKELRLIVIHSNHLTGSGAWDTVIVFDCVRGGMKEIFERKYLYGVKLETTIGKELSLSSGDWQPDDPVCCPSKVKKEIYRWNENKGTYTLKKVP